MPPTALPDATALGWRTPSATVVLKPGEVHVWRTDLDAVGEDAVARLACTLTDDERARAASFVLAPDRRRFTVARAALRDVLAGYLAVAPAQVPLGRTATGRPTLMGPRSGALGFSVSRSAGLALVAVAPAEDVGVDVERVVRGIADDVVNARVLSTAEVLALRGLPAAGRERAFFAVWTRKEAYAKARGLGLALAFDEFTVSCDPADAALLAAGDDDPGRWTLRDLEVGDGYAASLAVARTLGTIVAREWSGLRPR